MRDSPGNRNVAICQRPGAGAIPSRDVSVGDAGISARGICHGDTSAQRRGHTRGTGSIQHIALRLEKRANRLNLLERVSDSHSPNQGLQPGNFPATKPSVSIRRGQKNCRLQRAINHLPPTFS